MAGLAAVAAYLAAAFAAVATLASIAVFAIAAPVPYAPLVPGVPQTFSFSLLGGIILLHGGWAALGGLLALLAAFTVRRPALGRHVKEVPAALTSLLAVMLVVTAGLLLSVATGSADWLYSARPVGSSSPTVLGYGLALSIASLAAFCAVLIAAVAAWLGLRAATLFAPRRPETVRGDPE